MSNFLYPSDNVLPKLTPTFFTSVISSHSWAEVTRLLTISQSCGLFSGLPTFNHAAGSSQIALLFPENISPHLLCKAFFISQAVLHTSAPIHCAHHSVTIYMFLRISLQFSRSYPGLLPNTWCTIPDTHWSLHKCVLNAEVHFSSLISLVCWRDTLSKNFNVYLFLTVGSMVCSIS